jgi:DNA-binding CsgD family transcriptional regulator
MSTDTKTKFSVSPAGTGYNELATAWLDYCDHPENREASEAFGRHLDRLFRQRLPDRRCSGVLEGHEAEIRQEAYLLLVGSFLAGNRELITATQAQDHGRIACEILRSLAGSISAISRTLARHTIRYRRLHAGDPDLCSEAVCLHPSCRESLWELPFELQRELVFAVLERAIRNKLLAARGARIAMEMVDGNLTQSEVAASLGISRQAVHQQLGPVRDYLADHIEEEELPS